jgi:hypothetical protein
LEEEERGWKIGETQCLTCFKTSKFYKKNQEQKAIIILFFIDFLCLCAGSKEKSSVKWQFCGSGFRQL